MLRHYDEIGLMQPKMTDPSSGYRYYCEEQLTVAGRIQALKDMNFSLAAIMEILENYDDPEALAEFLSIKHIELQEQEKETRQRIRLLETAINRLRKDETAMNYNVTIKTLNPRYVASVRDVLPAYDQEGILWERMMTETGELKVDEPCYSMAIFHDEGYKENNVDVEIQVSVKGNYQNTEHVLFKNVPAITFASAVLKGSYEHLTEVNSCVAQWVRDNGYQFEGSMFCIYHVSPAQTQNPDELVTEVCFPIKQK
jgi:DNA-binding transcriptional MerR regulator